MQQDKTVEAYARLQALKANLPEHSSVKEKFVREFHEILNLLEQASGASLSSLRIPQEELKFPVISWNRKTGKVQYGSTPECDRAYLMMKIDGVLGLFDIQMSASPKAIGFNAR